MCDIDYNKCIMLSLYIVYIIFLYTISKCYAGHFMFQSELAFACWILSVLSGVLVTSFGLFFFFLIIVLLHCFGYIAGWTD